MNALTDEQIRDFARQLLENSDVFSDESLNEEDISEYLVNEAVLAFRDTILEIGDTALQNKLENIIIS